MKKVIFIIFSLIFFVLIYLFLISFYPKNTGMFPMIVILYILDVYLYWVYKNNIWSRTRRRGLVISFVYWLPMLMLISMILVSTYYPYEDWGRKFKNYFVGFILIGYLSKLVPLALMLISDLLMLIRRMTGKNRKKKDSKVKGITRSEFLKKVGLVTGGLVFGTFTLGMFKWIYDFRVRKKIVVLPELPENFQGFRIVQLSDIHLGSWLSMNEMKEAVQIVNDLNPDVVFFTGDLVNYSTDEAYPFMEVLDKIEARYGVYSTLGNHDYGDYKRWKSAEAKEKNMEEMYAVHRKLGWHLLNNQNKVLKIGNDKLAIIGVENWGSMRRFQKYGDLSVAIKGAEDIPVKLLLSHDPSHWQKKVLDFVPAIDLTFAGHTHGAQFGIEVPGMRWSPSQYIYKYWAGLYQEKNRKTQKTQYLYVNRGLGAIGYPGRVGILPEITLVELQKDN
ncbi:MAG: metallophosphoesterase [Bacteroidales bacterium]|nr:metallophosphoesterase [Bacteroidales bacterium]